MMILQRYIVEVDREQALRLSDDQVALATQISNGPTQLLIFRDRFLAYKIATRSGGTLRKGQVVSPEQGIVIGTGSFPLGDNLLMLEQGPLVAEA